MAYRNFLILGGAGFIGSHLTTYLAQHVDCQITVTTRRYEQTSHLLALPSVGVFAGDIHNENVLDTLVRDADVVINLVGTLYGGRPRRGRDYGKQFAAAHVDLTKKVVAACVKHGVERYLHMSAFGASDPADSSFLQSKIHGEDAAFSHPELNVTVFRPSIVFGQGDRFLTLLAALQQNHLLLPVTAPQTEFQPVFVGDVVQAMMHALKTDETIGQICSLVGPDVYTLRELFALTGSYTEHAKSVWEWAPNMAYLTRFFYPGSILQEGEFGFMQMAAKHRIDPISVEAFAAEMHITLTTVEEAAPAYLAPSTRDT